MHTRQPVWGADRKRRELYDDNRTGTAYLSLISLQNSLALEDAPTAHIQPAYSLHDAHSSRIEVHHQETPGKP